MHAKIQKWGNSLALRIPKPLAEESDLAQGSEVNISLVRGRLIIEPTRSPKYSLDELLDSVTSKNRHAEIDMGGPVGREAW